MEKILLRRVLLFLAACVLLYSCRTEDEAIASSTETGNIRYGISEQDFLQSKFITGLNAHKISNAKNTKTTISPEDLAQRLDFEKAHLSSYEGEEIMHVPVRVFGAYKRSLLTISRNKSSNAYLLTYPNPEDHRLFYITNLNGELLKEVRIGDDGKEIMQQNTQNKSSVSSKSGDFCTETVYVKCSSGQHSFATGNAYECEFWGNLKKGTPPTLFTVSMPCGDPGGSIGSGSTPAIPNPGGPKGGGVVPVGGGGPPKHNLTPSDCAAGIDCEDCNIPGDTNGDCILSYDEAMVMSGPCEKTKKMLQSPAVETKINDLKAQSKIKKGQPNYGEKGVNVKADGTTSATITGGEHHVDMGSEVGYQGGYHNHTPAGIQMLSPPDIIKLINYGISQPNLTYSNAFFGMIGSEECSSCPGGYKYHHYVIRFTGTKDELGNLSKKAWDKKALIQWYTDQESLLATVSSNSDNNGATLNNNGLEKLFFDALKKMGMEGQVNLQRIEDNGTINNITLNSDNIPSPTPCPQ